MTKVILTSQGQATCRRSSRDEGAVPLHTSFSEGGGEEKKNKGKLKFSFSPSIWCRPAWEGREVQGHRGGLFGTCPSPGGVNA